MLDRVLSWLVIFVPVALGLILVFVPPKRENPVAYKWWNRALGAALILYGGLSWWQQSRAVSLMEETQSQEIARYVVAAMLPQHPVKNSYELQQRIDQYLDALRRTKADHRGAPVYRQDGSIGVDWRISIKESLHVKDAVSVSKGP